MDCGRYVHVVSKGGEGNDLDLGEVCRLRRTAYDTSVATLVQKSNEHATTMDLRRA